jgi:hypothetical protein
LVVLGTSQPESGSPLSCRARERIAHHRALRVLLCAAAVATVLFDARAAARPAGIPRVRDADRRRRFRCPC